MRPYLKKTHHKKGAGGVAQGVGPEFNPQKKKEKKRKKGGAQMHPCFMLLIACLGKIILATSGFGIINKILQEC
jgi:hypothetical protein